MRTSQCRQGRTNPAAQDSRNAFAVSTEK